MGRSDEQAAKACGRSRATISEWKNHSPDFIMALNIAQNELVRATMLRYREKMVTMTDAAFRGVASAIKRGDAATARWWMDSIGINEIARRLFQETVDPVLPPEGMDAVIDEISTRRVDAFLTAKGTRPLERLRIRETLIAKEAEALREEHGEDDAEE